MRRTILLVLSALIFPSLGASQAAPARPHTDSRPQSQQQHPLSAPHPHLPSLHGEDRMDVGVQRYEGEQVWRVELGERDVKRIAEVVELIDELNLDVWRSTPRSLDIRLNAHQREVLKSQLDSGTSFVPFIDDLQSLIDTSTPSSSSSLVAELNSGKKGKKPKGDPFDLGTIMTPFHDEYNTLEDIYKFGETLVQTFSGVAGVVVDEIVVGKTWEGRDIRGWSAKIVQEPKPETESMSVDEGGEIEAERKRRRRKGRKGKEGVEDELAREFVVISGQHAREWVGPSSALYFLHSLLLAATSSPTSEAALLLRSFTFTVIPTINPDGYVYSRTHRMWRKNRQPSEIPGGGKKKNKGCVGIDLNSNWGYKWKSKKKVKPCADAYPGMQAFEAYETNAVGTWLAKGEERGTRVRAFVDLHSYGELFMFPFAHSCDDFPTDAEMLMEAGLGVSKAIRTTHGVPYETGQACDLTYRAPGDAVDYSYGVTDIRWSFSAELRDTGTYGFMLPTSLIRPTAEEIASGLTYLAKFIYVAEIEY